VAETWESLADDLLDVLNRIQASVNSGKSKLDPTLAGELDTAVRSLCHRIKAGEPDIRMTPGESMF
jgi:hypothetical protein